MQAKTPEGILARRQNDLPFGELAARFYRQAETQNVLLEGSINPFLQKIISKDAEDAEGMCLQIAKQNSKAFPDTLEDARQRAAYVLAVAYRMGKERKILH